MSLLSVSPAERRAFVKAQTRIKAPPLCPELPMHLITPETPLWSAGEADLEKLGLPPPFWGFAWPGGQALARYVLDHPEEVRGKRVLDFGAGCGIEALAALQVGAAEAVGADIDPLAEEAMQLNAALLDLPLITTTRDLLGQDEGWEVILAGDMFYDRELALAILEWLLRLAARGARVLLGDPHRGHLEPGVLIPVIQLEAPADVDVDGQYRKWTTLYTLARPEEAARADSSARGGRRETPPIIPA